MLRRQVEWPLSDLTTDKEAKLLVRAAQQALTNLAQYADSLGEMGEGFMEGKSPHKKGTKAYKKHMAAKHASMAEAKSKKKPDYLDFDGDKNKTEPMTKALRDKKKKKKKNENYKQRIANSLAESLKKSQGISESVKNFTNVGIPREYAEAFMKKYAVKQEAPIKEIDGVPKTSDIEEGSFIINVLPNGDVRGLGKTEVGFKEYRYSLLHMIDGEIVRPDRTANYNQAKQGMSKKGKFYTLHQSYWGLYRGRKPDETRTSQDQMVSGENIYGYMDKMFMTKMKPMLTQMSKDIWNKSEELDDKRPSIYSDSDLERAMKYRGYIKDFIEQGFTRKSMEDMLTMVNAYSPYSRKTYEQTEEALKKALAEIPAFRAKWAKQILSAARNYHKQVNNMYYKSTIDALKGEPA